MSATSSAGKAVISRRQDSRFRKLLPTTLVRRFISWLSLSGPLVVRTSLLWLAGNTDARGTPRSARRPSGGPTRATSRSRWKRSRGPAPWPARRRWHAGPQRAARVSIRPLWREGSLSSGPCNSSGDSPLEVPSDRCLHSPGALGDVCSPIGSRLRTSAILE